MGIGRVAVRVAAVWIVLGVVVVAAELKPRTRAAFDRYVAAAETRMRAERDGSEPFLWIDRLPAAEREKAYRRLRSGDVIVEKLEAREDGDRIKIPKGMAHHWVGTVLLSDASLDATLAMVRDYDRYAEFYTPNVRKSRVLERDGDRFKVYAQLFMKKVVTAVLDTEYDAEFIRVDADRVFVPSRTTRIVEVENVDTPRERRKTEGNDRGFLWRFNNYCSFEAQPDGTIMQCESISLSRGIPPFIGLFVKPFITGVPKESMTFTLEAARRNLTEDLVAADLP